MKFISENGGWLIEYDEPSHSWKGTHPDHPGALHTHRNLLGVLDAIYSYQQQQEIDNNACSRDAVHVGTTD